MEAGHGAETGSKGGRNSTSTLNSGVSPRGPGRWPDSDRGNPLCCASLRNALHVGRPWSSYWSSYIFPSPKEAGTYHAVPVQTGKQYHYQDILLCIKQNNVQGQPGLEILCFFPLESLAPVLSSVLLKTDAA